MPRGRERCWRACEAWAWAVLEMGVHTEGELLRLLAEDDDEGVEVVEVLAQHVEVDAVAHRRRVLEPDAPHLATQWHGDHVSDVKVDCDLRKVVEYQDGLRDVDGFPRSHELVQDVHTRKVRERARERHVRQVVRQRLHWRVQEERHCGRAATGVRPLEVGSVSGTRTLNSDARLLLCEHTRRDEARA